jgi:hypothetical protein
MNHALRTSSTNFAAHWGAGRTIPDSDTMYSNARPHEDNARNDAEAVRSSVASFFFSQARSTDTRQVRGRTRCHGRPDKKIGTSGWWGIKVDSKTERRRNNRFIEERPKDEACANALCQEYSFHDFGTERTRVRMNRKNGVRACQSHHGWLVAGRNPLKQQHRDKTA